MGKKGGFDYAYNARISVDADQQIIVAQHISQNANDKQEVEPALQALQESAGRLPEKQSANNGAWLLVGRNLGRIKPMASLQYLILSF